MSGVTGSGDLGHGSDAPAADLDTITSGCDPAPTAQVFSNDLQVLAQKANGQIRPRHRRPAKVSETRKHRRYGQWD